MEFSLLVRTGPVAGETATTALGFAQAAIASGHRVRRVFFQGDGVYNASRLLVPPQGQPDISEGWARLAQDHEVDLVVCVASALQRGMLDATEADRYERDASNLRAGFNISGLGQLVDAALTSDRLLTFG